ncbi:MAG: hypothetical protein AAGC93_07475 [Cyanobacteria bacterium P01_F01_bin.53]
MDIINLDYIAPVESNYSNDRRTAHKTRAPIVGGFGMAHFSAFASRFNSLSVEPLLSSEMEMLESFSENYAESQTTIGSNDFFIVDMVTSTGPTNSSGYPAFRSIAGGGILRDGGIFSFSSSASRAT